MITIREAIDKSVALMKSGKVEMPKMTSRLLMQYVLKCSRQDLIVYDQKPISKSQEEMFFKYVEKIRSGVPLQHITHQQEFMKMNFFVNQNVLIPRQDTEILVEETIEIAKKIKAKKILDLCTGSGIIAISLAKYIENSKIIATDVSKEALEVAMKNAKINKVENQVRFIQSDLFKNLKGQKFDIIVSNPPYIKNEVVKKLDKKVQNEPNIALCGGYDGLDFYRKIIPNSYQYLKTKGYLCLEIGYDQKDDVIEIIKNEEKFTNIYSKKDLGDNDRIVCARLM